MAKMETWLLQMVFDLENFFTLYRPEHYIIYAEFIVTQSLKKQCSINDKICLRRKLFLQSSREKSMDSHYTLKSVYKRKKSHVKSIHFV